MANKKRKGKKLTSAQLQTEIVRLFNRHPKKRFSAKQIIKKLYIINNKDSISYALEKLTEENLLTSLSDGKFCMKRNGSSEIPGQNIFDGYVDMTRSGAAYILCEGLENDVYVPAKSMNHALHGDRVKISVWIPKGRWRPEGKIEKVVERATESFLGTLHISRKYAIVIPDSLKMPMDIYVGLNDLKDAQDGDKVVVKVTEWPTRHNHYPKGLITAVLGSEGGTELAMKSILINNGFNLEFPENVEEESNALTSHLSEEEIAARRDFREVPTLTIDPEDAKDFDDAISLRYLENGHCEIGVHIADVTHFVKPGTALDREAFHRSTSVYLVDRVLPMLPEKLSNQLCSLRPNEDKCTFSAVFVFDKDDKVVDRWFGKTLIHSDRRFSYEEAQQVLESGAGDFTEELRQINRLAEKLRKQRFKDGAIAFESDEVKFRLNEEGVPVEAFVKERKDAHLLIEDLMLLANKEVASYIAEKGKEHEIPFIYRVHDEPNPDKVAEFARFAKEMDFEIQFDTPRQIANSYNRLAKLAREDDHFRLLEPIAIRTMSKAEYTTENIGHYGLGFNFYTHFTSPIRRYSDILAHRLLEKNLIGKTYRTQKESLEERCKHVSMQERKAMYAERESIKYFQVEFIKDHVGEVFTGYVSGFLDRGMFVELADNKCEGLVGFETMPEPFEFEGGQLRIKGTYSGKIIKMGDEVRVRILDADLARRQIEMELEVEEN